MHSGRYLGREQTRSRQQRRREMGRRRGSIGRGLGTTVAAAVQARDSRFSFSFSLRDIIVPIHISYDLSL